MTLSKKHASSEVLSCFFFKKNIYKAKNVKAISKSEIS